MKKIKLFLILFLLLSLICVNNITNSYADEFYSENENYDIVTTISSNISFNTISINALNSSKILSGNSSAKTITKTKTSKIYAKDGTLLWSISIKASFTYNGTTSKCTSCSHSASAPAKSWKIKSVSSSKKGNSATAIGIATHTDGLNSKDYTHSITIKCTKDGVVS